MSVHRSVRGSATEAEAARLRSQQKRQAHYETVVKARVYQTVPTIPLESQCEEDAILAFAHGNFVEQVKDYSNYPALGFNPEVEQMVLFQSMINREDGSRITHSTRRWLGAQTSPMSGPLFGEQDGKRAEDPIGSWRVVPANEQLTIQRARNRYFCEYGGVKMEIDFKQTFTSGRGGARWTYAGEIDHAACDPSEQILVQVVPEIFEEDAKVLDLGENRIFGHRNLVGKLHLEIGGKIAEFILMNTDEKTIIARRAEYDQQVDRWSKLSSEDRRIGRTQWKSPQAQMRPKMPFEAYLAHADAILQGEDKFFIALKRNTETGALAQVQMPLSQ